MRAAPVLLAVLIWLLCATINADEDKETATVYMLNGEEREIPMSQVEVLARNQFGSHPKNEETEETIEQMENQDPYLALHIRLADHAFAEIQKRGYAQGYLLQGFNEKSTSRPSPRASSKSSSKTKKPLVQEQEYRATLVLQAVIDPDHADPKTGTSAAKVKDPPPLVSYDVDVFVDANDVISLMRAWELSTKGQRWKKLSIAPSGVYQARGKSLRQQMLEIGITPTHILAGGMAFLCIGIVVLYSSRPTPLSVYREQTRGKTEGGSPWQLDKKYQ